LPSALFTSGLDSLVPFTLAHPAAAIPFANKRHIELAAFVAGTVAPDMEYVLRSAPISECSHTPAGMIWFCVPAGLVLLLFYHALWKWPVFGASRPFGILSRSRAATIAGSVWLGSLSHVVWDSFTHSYGWAACHLSVLQCPVFETHFGVLRAYKVLQHGSTVVGLAALACVGRRWLLRVAAERGFRESGLMGRRLVRIFALMTTVGLIAALSTPLTLRGVSPELHVRRCLGTGVIRGMSGALLAYTVYCVYWQYALKGAQCDCLDTHAQDG